MWHNLDLNKEWEPEKHYSVKIPLLKRVSAVNRNIFTYFIHFIKAFDNVKHDELINILKEKNIDSHHIRVISNFYWNPIAITKVADEFLDKIKIKQEIRQSCILSLLLFNIYSEAIFEVILHEHIGIEINGKFINNLRYTDDNAILAGNLAHLQKTIDRTNSTFNKYGT